MPRPDREARSTSALVALSSLALIARTTPTIPAASASTIAIAPATLRIPSLRSIWAIQARRPSICSSVDWGGLAAGCEPVAGLPSAPPGAGCSPVGGLLWPPSIEATLSSVGGWRRRRHDLAVGRLDRPALAHPGLDPAGEVVRVLARLAERIGGHPRAVAAAAVEEHRALAVDLARPGAELVHLDVAGTGEPSRLELRGRRTSISSAPASISSAAAEGASSRASAASVVWASSLTAGCLPGVSRRARHPAYDGATAVRSDGDLYHLRPRNPNSKEHRNPCPKP